MKSELNKVTLYRGLLRPYVDSNVATIQKFDDVMAAGDRKEIDHLAHAPKGGSVTRGIHAVSETATSPEKMDTDAPAEVFASSFATLKSEQDNEVRSIGKYLATN